MYHKRLVEDKIKKALKQFKIVLITGARQVGKTTLVTRLFPEYKKYTFDPVIDLYDVKKDPDLFLKNFGKKLFLDEIQYVPELLSSLKRLVDESDENGQYIISGSQNLSVMKNVAESLAGRVGIIDLATMTSYEIYKELPVKNWIEIYLNNPIDILTASKGLLKKANNLYLQIFRGGYPALLNKSEEDYAAFFSSYVRTYIERDIRAFKDIKELSLFERFLGIVAALTANEINYDKIGERVGITAKTVQSWLDLLKYTYQYYELHYFSNNSIKRISKKRKSHIRDTGLACYLQRVSSVDALIRHPNFGALFESFCISNILTLCDTMKSVSPYAYHWRSYDKAEVDLILERDNKLYPIEIKCKTKITKNDTSGIRAFVKAYPNHNVQMGLIIYAGDEVYKVNDFVFAVPWNILT
jgi:uncharacterized protein